MIEWMPGVYEHKRSYLPNLWILLVNTDFFAPNADWMDSYISMAKGHSMEFERGLAGTGFSLTFKKMRPDK